MHRRFFAATPLVALATTLALAACGSSNSSSSSSGAGSSAGASSSIAVGGGSFCDQTRSVIAQISQLGKSLVPTTPGATPNVAAFKQLIGTVTSAIDQLDGSAPGEIASAFHTFRAAYDQANTTVQSATTFDQMSNAFSNTDTPAVKSAGDQITAYLKNTCGINPSATP